MAEKVASLYAEIGANTTGLKRGLAETKTGLTQASQQFGKFGGVIGQSVGMLATLGGGLAIAGAAFGVMTKAISGAIAEASEAEQVEARLNAVLQSTQGAAGLTADEINNMANEMSQLTAVDDEAIVSAQAMLLTFTKIGRDIFPEATMAVLNMASVFGSLDSAAIQVGKALQDPISGLTALRRVGVNFDESSKQIIEDFIKMGDTASAQKFILEELNTEFGGQAAAQALTYAGSIKQIGISLGNLGEEVAGDAVTQLSAFNLVIADTIDMLADYVILAGMMPKLEMAEPQGAGWVFDWSKAVDQNAQSHYQQAIAIKKSQAEAERLNNISIVTGKNMGIWGKKVSDVSTETLPKFADMLKYARDETELARIGQMIFGDEIDASNESLLMGQRALDLQRLAYGDLDEATRTLIESEIEEIDTKLQIIEATKGIAQAEMEVAQAAESTAPKVADLFNLVDTNLGSPMKAFIDDMKFFMAGGAEFTKAFDAIKTAFMNEQITPQEAIDWTSALFVEFNDEMANAGLQSKSDAQRNIMDALGIPIDEAKAKMNEFDGALEVMTAATYPLNFEIVVTGDTWVLKYLGVGGSLGGGGGGGGGGEGGGGGDGNYTRQMGGPVFMGNPYIVGEAGPELFVPRQSGEIVSNKQLGKMGGGDIINIYNNSRGAAALTMAIIAQNHRARLSRSMGG